MLTAKEIIEAMGAPNTEDKALVEKAYAFAEKAHEGQKRFSGEPYMVHLSRVARSIAELGMGAKTVAAGLLHDTIEDTNATTEQIEQEFGKEILFLVEG